MSYEKHAKRVILLWNHGQSSKSLKPSKVYVIAIVLFFCLMQLWSLATPLFAGPDEPVQIIKSYAVDHGQLLGQLDTQPGQQEFSMVHVPGFYSVDRAIPKCYDHHSNIPASCAPPPTTSCHHLPGSTAPPCGVAFIYNARYPPLYYLVIGTVGFISPSQTVIYLMRALSALIASALLALAVMSSLCYCSRPIIATGLVIAITPMVIYLGAVVNPASLEIAAGLATWTTGIILATDNQDIYRRKLIIFLTISASVMVLSRPISPFWLSLIAVFIVILAGKDRLSSLVGRRDFQVMMAVVFFFSLVATIWILKEHATDVLSTSKVPASVPMINILEQSFRHNIYYIPTMVGVFGTFDTYSPAFTYVLYYAMIVLIFLLSFIAGSKKEKFLLVALAVLIILLPVAISSSQAHLYGYTWNGKDTLPFAVGLPILAAAVIVKKIFAADTRPVMVANEAVVVSSGLSSALSAPDKDRIDHETSGEGKRKSITLRKPFVIIFANLQKLWFSFLLMAALGQFLSFYEAIRRYSVGIAGPDFAFLWKAPWNAPLGNATLVGLDFILMCIFVILGKKVISGQIIGQDSVK